MFDLDQLVPQLKPPELPALPPMYMLALMLKFQRGDAYDLIAHIGVIINSKAFMVSGSGQSSLSLLLIKNMVNQLLRGQQMDLGLMNLYMNFAQ